MLVLLRIVGDLNGQFNAELYSLFKHLLFYCCLHIFNMEKFCASLCLNWEIDVVNLFPIYTKILSHPEINMPNMKPSVFFWFLESRHKSHMCLVWN